MLRRGVGECLSISRANRAIEICQKKKQLKKMEKNLSGDCDETILNACARAYAINVIDIL